MIRGKQINGELRPESERRLNEIWFIWNASEGKWDAMSRALTQFKQREGHCNVFVKHIEYLDHGGGKLNKLNPGGWLAYQRILQGRGKLDAKKAELLESLGVKWIVNFQEDWTGTSICCWYSRSEKGTCGCQRNTKKVALIILERGWRINGCYIGLGVSNWIGRSGSR
jgi:hypothetical protein